MNDPVTTRLLAYLRSSEFALDTAVDESTRLLDSGLLDSLGLFKLAVWIEGEVGAAIDLSAVDAVRDWNSVERITAFIAGQRP